MTMTLCLRPRGGEPCTTVMYRLAESPTVLAVAARHLVIRVGLDPEDGTTPAVWLDAATERARPVHVRLELVGPAGRVPPAGRLLGSVPGRELNVYGSYLGPVSEEN